MKAFRLPENFSDWGAIVVAGAGMLFGGQESLLANSGMAQGVSLRNFLPAFFFTVRFICLPALKAICFFAFAPQFWLFAFPDITIKNASARKDFLLSARAP